MLEASILGLCLVLTILASLVIYARWNFGSLEKLGIPVMKPHFLFGSVPNLHKEIQHFEDYKRFKEYGPIWGVYEGRTPIIYICDPNLIREIFVKDSDYFFDRNMVDMGDDHMNEILDANKGEKWKTLRITQTKLFSSSKLKKMSVEIFEPCINEFIKMLGKDLDRGIESFDLHEQFYYYTIEIIGRSTLSLKVDSTNNSKMFNSIKKMVLSGEEFSFMLSLSKVFPFLSRLEPSFVIEEELTSTIWSSINERKRAGEKFQDFGDTMLQLMEKINNDDLEMVKLGISKTTVMAQAINLFLAGFDRISSIMTLLCYELGKNPKIQEKLHEELDTFIENPNDEIIGLDVLEKLKYLEACITEVLRLYPPLIRPERVCTKSWTSKETGLKIPKGFNVAIASWAANRNPEFFEDPDSFLPTRFLENNLQNQYTLTSFGFGHRKCLGMRYSYLALKASLAHFLVQHQIEMLPETELKFRPGSMLIYHFYPLYLKIQRRF